MTRAEPVRTALIGYGLGGAVFHAPLIAATDGMELTAVVTSNPERSAAAQQRYPGVHVFGSPDDVWRAAQDFDLVVIATPNASHVPLGLAALFAGLPVVIDKPVSATAAAARSLRDAAAERDLMVSVYQNRRWDGDFRTLGQLMSDGELGQVHRFESRFERWRPEVSGTVWREQADPEQAGGLLYDLGSHLIDQALVLFGPAASVYAEVRSVREGAQVDDDVFVALTHEGGAISHLWASAVAADIGPRFRVLGSTSSYVTTGLDPQEAALRAGGSPADPGWGEYPPDAWGRLGVPGGNAAVPTLAGAYQRYYEDVRDALRVTAPPPVTINQAIEVIEVIEAAQRSARDGMTIHC